MNKEVIKAARKIKEYCKSAGCRNCELYYTIKCKFKLEVCPRRWPLPEEKCTVHLDVKEMGNE